MSGTEEEEISARLQSATNEDGSTKSKSQLKKEEKRRKAEMKKAAKAASGGSAAAGGKPTKSTKKHAMEPVEEAPRKKRTPPSWNGPVLPEEGRENVLITSALPYVNNVPHLGNIIGCVLSADVYARWCRQRGKNAIYICGTDEYGTATETKAIQEGTTPREICDKYFDVHKRVYEWFDIQFDHFGRTSCPDPANSPEWPHTQIAHEIFLDNYRNGNILEKSSTQIFCTGCDRFLADRLIEGVCPKCKYDDARGDQCDSCGGLLTPFELESRRCKLSGDHSLEERETKHMFLDLGKLQPELEKWVHKAVTDGEWTENGVTITESWLNKGLEPRAITRDLKWGTPVVTPETEKVLPLEEYRGKVFYVWFDAPIGYISITANYTSEWRQWWQNPKNVKLQQFMGKDNVPFHSVVFPCTLLGTGREWTLLHHLSTTEYLNYEAGKFSKSRNIGVFGDQVWETGIPTEVWRYYLLSVRPETQDSVFNWKDFADRNNNELLKNPGNLVNRALKLCNSRYDSKIPDAASDANKFPEEVEAAKQAAAARYSTFYGENREVPTPQEADTASARDTALIGEVNFHLEEYNDLMSHVALRKALLKVMRISSAGNLYIQDTQPWVLKDSDPERCKTVVANSIALVRLLAAVAEPFMPGFTDKVAYQLQLDHIDIPSSFNPADLAPGAHEIGTAQPLFSTITDEAIQQYREKFGGPPEEEAPKAKKKPQKDTREDVDPFARVDIRVGKIVKAWKHDKADKLYCEEIDVGEPSHRQIISGLVNHYDIADLEGRKVLVVSNLKSKKMVGLSSQGMVLCANKGEKVEFVDPPAGAEVGERVCAEGVAMDEPDTVIDPSKKKNPWKEVLEYLKTNDKAEACYAGQRLVAAGERCQAASLTEASIY